MKKDFRTAVEEVKMHSDIVDVIGSYISVKRAGNTFKACCPFHNEKTPSFNINPQRQIYHCFGCGVGGDVIKFVQEYEKVDFMTALRLLAEKANITLEFDRNGASDSGVNKNRLYEIHEIAALFFHKQLLENQAGAAGREYLKGRELADETVRDFLIGYIPEGWSALHDLLRSKGFSPKEIELSGLVVESQKTPGRFYDRFRDRLMFPIGDQLGRIIGFSGRAIAAEYTGGKYVNSPETPLFHKSRVLFALDKARKEIADTQTALIVEGQIDAIRCHEAGIKNVVASQGTALTSQHAKLLSRYTDEIILILDADAAGENAALKSIEAFLMEDLSVRVCSLPEGEDPDSLIKKEGADHFKELVKNAPDAIDFQINVLSSREDLSNNAALMRVVKEVQQTLSLIRSSVLRDKLTEKAAERLGISAEALKKDVRTEFINRPKTEENRPATIGAPIRKIDDHPTDEKELCKIVAMFHDEVLSLVADYISPMHFTNIDCRKIYEVLLHHRVDALMNELHSVSTECLRLAAEIQATPDKNVGDYFKKEEEAHQLMLSIIRKNATLERDSLKKKYGDEMPESVQRRRLELTQIINAKTWQAAVKYLEPLH